MWRKNKNNKSSHKAYSSTAKDAMNYKNSKVEHDRIKSTQQMDTLVGPNTHINGDLTFSGGLHVDGTIDGNVVTEPNNTSLLVVGKSAKIKGDVKVGRAVINGYITGNLYVYDHLELGEKAFVQGDVHYNLIEMAIGSEVRGSLVPDIKQEPRTLLEDHSLREKTKAAVSENKRSQHNSQSETADAV